MADEMGPAPAVQTRQVQNLEEQYGSLAKLRENAAAALETATGLQLGNDFGKWRQVLPQISDAAVGDKPPAPTAQSTTYYEPESIIVGTKIILPAMADS
jgi:hypothetical protein